MSCLFGYDCVKSRLFNACSMEARVIDHWFFRRYGKYIWYSVPFDTFELWMHCWTLLCCCMYCQPKFPSIFKQPIEGLGEKTLWWMQNRPTSTKILWSSNKRATSQSRAHNIFGSITINYTPTWSCFSTNSLKRSFRHNVPSIWQINFNHSLGNLVKSRFHSSCADKNLTSCKCQSLQY